MGILSWIVLGLIVGILAKWIMPGRDGGGFISTSLGLGSVNGFNVASLLISIAGALLLLFIYRRIRS